AIGERRRSKEEFDARPESEPQLVTGPCLNFFKFVAACRRSAIIGRFAATRCCVAANAPVGGVIIGCCTSARLQFEWIVLRSGQRIIASFRQKRQIGAAQAGRALLDASGPLGDD
ncbi:hypothetical protein DEE58_37215, partial [Burkholderia cepacia]|uniref:hypothetical protein n=1 Tax=Burkholderia cepacia TaxID=292 RepID=UPI0016044B78